MNALLAAEQSGSSDSTLSLIIAIAEIAGLWKMLEKAGLPGWNAIIPLYNYYKLCEKVLGNGWYFITLCIPIVRWYFKYVIGKATAAAYGKPESWTWGYMFVPCIFYCLTGFDQSSYYGPMGAADTRTGDARQARTVDFDVIKEAPASDYRAEADVKTDQAGADAAAGAARGEVKQAPAGESNVDFEFNQEVEE